MNELHLTDYERKIIADSGISEAMWRRTESGILATGDEGTGTFATIAPEGRKRKGTDLVSQEDYAQYKSIIDSAIERGAIATAAFGQWMRILMFDPERNGKLLAELPGRKLPESQQGKSGVGSVINTLAPSVKETVTRCFLNGWHDVATLAHNNAKLKGFWETDRNNGEACMLIVTEVSEGFDALRNHNAKSDKIPEFLGIEEELADAIIRIMDLSAARGWRVAEALLAKMEYNAGRPYKHGKTC